MLVHQRVNHIESSYVAPLPRSLQWISSCASRYFSAASSDTCCSSAARSADNGSTGRQPCGSARLVAWTWCATGGHGALGNMATSQKKMAKMVKNLEMRRTMIKWSVEKHRTASLEILFDLFGSFWAYYMVTFMCVFFTWKVGKMMILGAGDGLEGKKNVGSVEVIHGKDDKN